MSIVELLFEKDISFGLKQLATIGEIGESRFEIALKRKDGEPVYVILNSVRLPNGNIIAFCENITERKKTEVALSVSEAKLRSVVENSSDQIFMIDRTLKYLFVNKVLAEILGKRPEDIIGKSIFECILRKLRINSQVIPKMYSPLAKACLLRKKWLLTIKICVSVPA